MKNRFLKITSLSLLTSSILFASGWRIPEQSATSVALSGAYVANSSGADTSYNNPANMSFNKNTILSEISLMGINLSSIEYEDSRTSTYDSSSEKENFIIPTLFVSTEDKNGLRYGFSITAPGGLSKRWEDTFAKTSAEEFTLKIVEFNPVVSYLINPQFSIAGGLRAIYSEGIVKSDGVSQSEKTGVGTIYGNIKRDMEGDTISYGYNVAMAYKPTKTSNLSLTYRSNINLNEEGTATLSNGAWKVKQQAPGGPYPAGTTLVAPAEDKVDASVEVPLPAVLAIAYSHKINKTTIELEYDKTYWSKYKGLDFKYNKELSNSILKGAFDDSKEKNYNDTVTYRIGITHQYSDALTLMVGYAIDESPTPTKTLGFELPDSDAKLYSFGFNYKMDNISSIGFGYLIDIKESKTVKNNDNKIDGEFTNAKAHLISFAYRMGF